MAVDRREPALRRSFGVLLLLLCVGMAGVFLYHAADIVWSPSSPVARYRDTPQPPRVFVRGTLRTAPSSSLPPLCRFARERYGYCRGLRCWKSVNAVTTSQAVLDVAWSSSPTAAEVDLASRFSIEPVEPKALRIDGDPASPLAAMARKAELRFSDVGKDERLVARCLAEGETVFVAGCLSNSGAPIGPCAGESNYFIVRGGDPQAAIDEVADEAALGVGMAFLALLVALLVGMLVIFPQKGPLVDERAALSAPSQPKTRRVLWLLVAVPPAAFVFNIFLHTRHAPSTLATGRGGFVLAITAIVACTIFARWLLLRRATMLVVAASCFAGLASAATVFLAWL